MPICQFSLNISQWKMVCNRALSPKDWQQGKTHWVTHLHQWQAVAPKLAFLPALKRRRLSDAARLFFEAAWDLVGEQSDIPVVYSSLNGEINRSFTLWQSLFQEGNVSPTSFSLSVHNALIGQWSEMRQVKSEMTAITASQDGLETALMEAYLLLNEGYERVLVVICESPLSAGYGVQPIKSQPFSYALAMVVERGEQYQLSLTTEQIENGDSMDNALIWVQQTYLAGKEWKTPSSRDGCWYWVRK